MPMLLHYGQTLWQRFFGLNVSQIDPLLFVGGQFEPHEWAQLYARGIRAVLSLQAERADRFTDPLPTQALRLLVPDYHAPTLDQLVTAVAFIAAAHTNGLPVLVHCHAGVGRAPTTAAAFLVAQQALTHRDALERIRTARPIMRINPEQRARLCEWEQAIRSAQ